MSDNNPARGMTPPTDHYSPEIVQVNGLDNKSFNAAETEARALSANRGDGQHSTEIMALEGRLGVLLARVADKDSLSPDEEREILQVSKTLEYQRRSAERAVAEQPALPERPTNGSFGRDAVHVAALPAQTAYAAQATFRADHEAAVNRTMRKYSARGHALTVTEAERIVTAEAAVDRAAVYPQFDRVMKRLGQ